MNFLDYQRNMTYCPPCTRNVKCFVFCLFKHILQVNKNKRKKQMVTCTIHLSVIRNGDRKELVLAEDD